MARKPSFAGLPPTRSQRRHVAILVFDGAVLGDVAIPTEVFGRAIDARGRGAYEVVVCAERRRARTEHVVLSVPQDLTALRRAHTIIVPGIDRPDRAISDAVQRALVAAHRRGARIASVCSGAFVLAAAGLLDGRSATTHWLAAAELSKRHPRVRVDPRVLYVDEGSVLTSAGAAAAFDLCLHLVRLDCGAAAAAQTARACVMPLERAGGQAQFIAHPPPQLASPLAKLLAWAEGDVTADLSLTALAARAGMSERTLSRRFKDEVGATPAAWVARTRVRRAQHLLETTDLSVDRVADEAGFRSATVLRDVFARVVGTTPKAHRRAFGPASASAGRRAQRRVELSDGGAGRAPQPGRTARAAR